MRTPAAALVSLALLVGGCTAGATTAPAPQASGTVQSLVFTGPAPGILTLAAATCRLSGSMREFDADFEGVVGGQKLNLSIQVLHDFKGAGTYPVGGIIDGGASLSMTFGKYAGTTLGGAGTMVVNADGKSGTLDAELTDKERVRGKWQCDKVSGS